MRNINRNQESPVELASIQMVVDQRAKRVHFLAMGRPDLALPDVYALKPISSLDTLMQGGPQNYLYR
tara:strand:- start:48 stop:248 length:201 start_codon:yes stop_codon:yes gene_type:complete